MYTESETQSGRADGRLKSGMCWFIFHLLDASLILWRFELKEYILSRFNHSMTHIQIFNVQMPPQNVFLIVNKMDHLKADDFDCQTGLRRSLIPSGGSVERPCVLWPVISCPVSTTVFLTQFLRWYSLCGKMRKDNNLYIYDHKTHNWKPILDGQLSWEPCVLRPSPRIQLVPSVLLCTSWTTAGEATERTTINFMSHLSFERQSIILIDQFQCNILIWKTYIFRANVNCTLILMKQKAFATHVRYV